MVLINKPVSIDVIINKTKNLLKKKQQLRSNIKN